MITSKYVVLILMIKSLSTLNNIVVIKKNGEISNYLRSEVNDIWNATNHLSSNNNQSFYGIRVDLSDCLVRASCSENINKSSYKKMTREKAVTQFHIELFKLLQEIHNFSYEISIEKSKNFDFGFAEHILENLQNNKTDIYLSGEIQTPSKIDKINFLMPFYNFRTCFFFRLPKKSTLSFIKPFSKNTWYVIIISTIVFTIFLKIALVMSEADESTWIFSFLTVFSTLCQDGDDPSPSERDTGCKLAFLSVLVLSLLLFNYYTSIMVSMLLSAEIKIEHNVDHLIHSNLEIGIENESYIKNWLDSVDFPKIQQLYKRKLINSKNQTLNTYSTVEGLSKVALGGFAYYTDTSTAYNTIGSFKQEQICKLDQIQMVPPSFVGLAMQKKSELFELFQISLLKLRETGFIHELQQKWEVSKPECYGNTEMVPVGMEQGLEALICLIIGVFLSPIILLVEIILRKKRK